MCVCLAARLSLVLAFLCLGVSLMLFLVRFLSRVSPLWRRWVAGVSAGGVLGLPLSLVWFALFSPVFVPFLVLRAVVFRRFPRPAVSFPPEAVLSSAFSPSSFPLVGSWVCVPASRVSSVRAVSLCPAVVVRRSGRVLFWWVWVSRGWSFLVSLSGQLVC